MPIAPNARSHPDVAGDVGPLHTFAEHVMAVSKLVTLHDALFNGPATHGDLPWLGAQRRIQDFGHLVPGSSDPQYWTVEEYGPRDIEGVVACYAETASGRPVMMAIAPFGGSVPGAAADEYEAARWAENLARVRSADL